MRGQTSIEYIVLVGVAVLLALTVASALNTFYTLISNATDVVSALRQNFGQPIFPSG